jgi:RNA polymerase sigma-70 factor (ECF subfamily)
VSTLSINNPDLDHPAPARGSVPERDFPQRSTDESIAGIIDQHGAALSRFLHRLTRGDHHRAEDIYQETLVRAWKHPECCQEGNATNRPWLFTVARRYSIDQLRAATARLTEASGEHLTDCADPVDQVDRLLIAGEVRAALKSLSPRHREVLWEMYFEDHSVAEAAERLGIPAGTVKSRAYYALHALKGALAERGLDQTTIHL